jgi:hypothetical protein
MRKDNRFSSIALWTISAILASQSLYAQGRQEPGKSIGSVSVRGNLIVMTLEGPRLPDVEHSQKTFNTGMVVVVEHGKNPSKELIERTNGIRLRWMDYWETTTGHRSSMTTNPR